MSQWGYIVGSPSPCGFTGRLSPFVAGLKAKPCGCSGDCEYMKTPRPGDVC